MKRPYWTQPEIDRLIELVGDYHISGIYRNYNSWASRNHYPHRTQRALKYRIGLLGLLGLSRRPEGIRLALADVAKILGRSPRCVRNWITRGWIPPQYVQRPSPQVTLIHRGGMDHLARTNPHVFAGCSLYSLLATLGSDPLAEDLHEQLQGSRWASQRHPVLCVETGQRYPSVEAAARAHYLNPRTIRYAMQNGRRAADKHWRSLQPCHAPAVKGVAP